MTQKQKVGCDEYFRSELAVTLAFVTCAAMFLTLLLVHLSIAQDQEPRTFPSAEEAGSALFTAAQNEDDKTLLAILGPAGKEIISSGDPAADMEERVGFVVKYQEMHRYVKKADGSTILYVGAENWPFPIPLVKNNRAWYFDTDAGKEEILMRRIGRNELAAIDACHQLVDAEKQYFKKPYNGQPHYTQRFMSDKGKHNGLFWSETVDDFDSPIDPLIASAGQEDENSRGEAGWAQEPIPFNGYYFRILTRQGENAPGGAKSYIVDGKMIGGFAFVAYPAEYRSSGVMTFIVNRSGVVYEKDLGPHSIKLATAITSYNADSTWRRVD